jgi:AAA15 family ATPase/GTPase
MIFKTVKIQNFRNLENIDVKLSNFNVLIGENGSGKSNFLKGILNSLSPIYPTYANSNPITDSSPSGNSDFYSRFDISGIELEKLYQVSDVLKKDLIGQNSSYLELESELIFNGRPLQGILKLNLGKNLSSGGFISNAFPVTVSPHYLNPNSLSSLLNLFVLNEVREIPQNTPGNTGQKPGEYNVVNALLEMKLNQIEKYNSIMEKAVRIAREIKSLKTSLENGRVMVNMGITGFNRVIPSHLISKGLRELLILLITFEYAPPGSSIIIEEPEIHLHPSAIRELKQIMLTTVKENRIQIIMTTHSPLFLSDIYPEQDTDAKFIQFKKRNDSAFCDVREISKDNEVSDLISFMERGEM